MEDGSMRFVRRLSVSVRQMVKGLLRCVIRFRFPKREFRWSSVLGCWILLGIFYFACFYHEEGSKLILGRVMSVSPYWRFWKGEVLHLLWMLVVDYVRGWWSCFMTGSKGRDNCGGWKFKGRFEGCEKKDDRRDVIMMHHIGYKGLTDRSNTSGLCQMVACTWFPFLHILKVGSTLTFPSVATVALSWMSTLKKLAYGYFLYNISKNGGICLHFKFDTTPTWIAEQPDEDSAVLNCSRPDACSTSPPGNNVVIWKILSQDLVVLIWFFPFF